MKLDSNKNHEQPPRGERGAALITMLLVSVLLLGAGGALIMTTMMSANNSIGSTAGDAGVLRGRVGNAVGAKRAAWKHAAFGYTQPTG